MHKVLLVCHATANVGLGHLSRLLALAQALREVGRAQPRFLILGDPINNNNLSDFSASFMPFSNDFATSVKNDVEVHKSDVVVFDIYVRLADALSGC